jgi:two-component system, LytTR family, response regulator
MGMHKYSLLIVDDEQAAREGTRVLLEQDPEINVIAECSNGEDAVNTIVDAAPHIVVLDVEMPGLDGFAVLGELDPSIRPEVVFLTAYEEYALKAFDVEAADYVLKPFSDARLQQAIERAKARVRTRASEHRTLTRLVARQGSVTHVVPVDEIDWIEGADYYARVHTASTSHMVRMPLTRLLEQLDGRKFVRVHRSVIVNADRITRIIPHADLGVVLKSGKRLPLSRRLRPRVEEFLRGRSTHDC